MESKALRILQNYWGHERFRPLQYPTIASILSGRDTLALLPTGGGKSVCFQLPALMRAGSCLIISPLVSLMKDQQAQLRAKGIKSLYLHGNCSAAELHRLFDNLKYGGYKFLYMTPERLGNRAVITRLKNLRLRFVAVDEAHCISQWGHDFRPAYQKIKNFRAAFSHIPFLALTATATPRVVADIERGLALQAPVVFRRSFQRENLSFRVVHTSVKEGVIAAILQRRKGAAIVYTRSRKAAEQLSKYLNNRGVHSTFYHAGLTAAARDSRQEAWMAGRVQTLVATTAFGMGIDKPDVRCVIHRDLPESIEALYQEAGRAGRDGKPACSWLLKNASDRGVMKSRLAHRSLSMAHILDIYVKLNNHFQVRFGERNERVHPIDLSAFSEKHGLDPRLVHRVLKVLERYEVIRFFEWSNPRSSIRIQVNPAQLQALYKRGPLTERTVETLVRLYGGIFSEASYIDEARIADRSRLDLPTVKRVLHNLHAHAVVGYTPKAVQRIQFLVPREDARTLKAFEKGFLEVQQWRASRMQAVLHYAFQRELCRNRVILDYFGEKTTADCGKCDICLSRVGKWSDEWYGR